MMIPHPPIQLSHVHTFDIILLFTTAALSTFLHRTILYLSCVRSYARWSTAEKTKLREMQYKTAKLRAKGPSAFVETSKMERQILVKEKEMSKRTSRYASRVKTLGKFHKRFTWFAYALVVIAYYRSPVIRVGDGVDDAEAKSFWRGMAFPLSVIGTGVKVANFRAGEGGIGALIVYFAGQSTAEKVVECVQALLVALSP